jgi:hypothetical protein
MCDKYVLELQRILKVTNKYFSSKRALRQADITYIAKILF